MQTIWSEQGQLPEQAERIRRDVFMQEQGFCEEFDELDEKSWHVLLQAGDDVIGTARMFWEQEHVMHIGRVAVCNYARGGGNGACILQACCEKAKALGADRVILGAQCRAVEFYKKSGFMPYGEIFDDEGCPHQMMEKKL